MAISVYLYPSITYLNDSGVEKTYYGNDANRVKYTFGKIDHAYTTTGYIDERIILMSNLNDIIMQIVQVVDGRGKIWKFTQNGSLRSYKATIRLFTKKVKSIGNNPNICIELNIECRAYGEDKTTPVPYNSSEHLWTLVRYNCTERLCNGSANIISTAYNPYLIDEMYRGIYEFPYHDSLYLFATAFGSNNLNWCVHPVIDAKDIISSETLQEYINSIDNICLIGDSERNTDTRDRVFYTMSSINTNLKTFFRNFWSAPKINTSDVPEPVSDDNVGNNDNSSDYVPSGDLPSINTFASGLITAYNVDVSNLSSLANFLWDDNFIESLPKLVSNPMDAIICLKSYPINLENYGSTSTIKIGGIDTEISAVRVGSQYVLIDCGVLDVKEYYGDFTDYDNTTVIINLPYVGEHVLPSDEVLESTLHLIYKIDLLSGACMAQIEVAKNRFGTVLQGSIYNFKGNISCDYPLTGQIYGNIINALNGLFTTNFAMALNSANNIVNGERKIEINGNHSENYGALGTQVPYIKIVSPIQNNPSSYNRDLGAYANQTATIGHLKGYTEIDAINLKISGATDEELSEIKTALYNGVVIY